MKKTSKNHKKKKGKDVRWSGDMRGWITFSKGMGGEKKYEKRRNSCVVKAMSLGILDPGEKVRKRRALEKRDGGQARIEGKGSKKERCHYEPEG